MPVTETTARSLTTRKGLSKKGHGLLAELVAELRAPRATGQPRVEVREMARGKRHVYVYWDRWHGREVGDRIEVVRAALHDVKGEGYAESVSFVIPATFPDAAESGRLPFQVKPLGWDKATAAARKAAHKALLDLGGSVLGDPPVPALHFGTAEEAGAVTGMLRDRVPGLDWYVVETRFVNG